MEINTIEEFKAECDRRNIKYQSISIKTHRPLSEIELVYIKGLLDNRTFRVSKHSESDYALEEPVNHFYVRDGGWCSVWHVDDIFDELERRLHGLY